jgi:hypothetical protein
MSEGAQEGKGRDCKYLYTAGKDQLEMTVEVASVKSTKLSKKTVPHAIAVAAVACATLEAPDPKSAAGTLSS